MNRRIAVFPSRSVISLDGIWNFLPEERPFRSRPPPLEAFSEKLPVPGVWETAFSHYRFRGFGWYGRTFELAAPAPVSARLVFGAVSRTAEVFLDGRFLGTHEGAHTTFDFLIPTLSPGHHELVVRVGNTFGSHNPLYYPEQDIYLYGGIPQPVWIEILPPRYVRSACALPHKTKTGWRLAINVEMGAPPHPPSEIASVTLNGVPLGTFKIRKGQGRALLDPGPVHPWEPETPILYGVRIETSNDIWQERIGFRTISVRGNRLLLNGKPIFLKGVNRHEFHPDFGPALPPVVHWRDIQILLMLKANFVRGSHYPNSPFFLDLCDEYGLLFWEELAHWQPREEDFRNPLFLRHSLQQLEEMVLQHRHHPSIILWGMLNEGQTWKEAARPIVRTLARRFRTLDPTRPVTFATCAPLGDRCLDLVDVVACNTYPGWYSGDLETAGARLHDLLRKLKKRAKGKPLLVSEFGAAGMAGVRDFELRKWTEPYQAELLLRLLNVLRTFPGLGGAIIWQFCDVRTSDRLMSRIREYNNKGLLTEFRRPKDAFFTVRDVFRNIPSNPSTPFREKSS